MKAINRNPSKLQICPSYHMFQIDRHHIVSSKTSKKRLYVVYAIVLSGVNGTQQTSLVHRRFTDFKRLFHALKLHEQPQVVEHFSVFQDNRVLTLTKRFDDKFLSYRREQLQQFLTYIEQEKSLLLNQAVTDFIIQDSPVEL